MDRFVKHFVTLVSSYVILLLLSIKCRYLRKSEEILKERGHMTPLMLRQLWALVETSQTSILLNLDDNNLVQWLLRRIRAERSLDHNETDVLASYIHSKLTLIRDLAEERCV
jgi:hypothetical protein